MKDINVPQLNVVRSCPQFIKLFFFIFWRPFCVLKLLTCIITVILQMSKQMQRGEIIPFQGHRAKAQNRDSLSHLAQSTRFVLICDLLPLQ